MSKKLLWLDDYRDPMEGQWLVFSPISSEDLEVYWVKSYDEFTLWIHDNGLPDAICFDHDLGKDIAKNARSKRLSKKASRNLKIGLKTGYDAAKWLVNYCQGNRFELPLYNIQSANPVGKENIDKLLKNYLKYKRNE